ncbi:polysaccharide biosynthesis protein [Rhodococcus triatomae]|uniref:Membrane protein involved in the export of O-antigen and teichoic acid n=1 Tax=Rhodococcus triatomae TaxID=300028 RepID=A0A1G8GTY4_9NOCA|nr:polysaccharide biosynthesis protein [Rhodococcus triatomae]QNG20300.1 polysaccharide biosynthesis protein [Rhodococcus triatomae]QNG23785.1 polysaccharide biosynthesis protein [Rhodococcus triatomae]SDH97812.1 Membrane protein involved in the export of O-antigen and teichoic acid [Rhodococcus triatomae]
MSPRAESSSDARSAVAGMTLVTAGSMAANIAAYLLHLPASRWLGPAGYGEFASLLAAQLVLAVPALALQTVVAREVVRGASSHAGRALAGRCVVIVAVLAAAAVPVVSWALDTGILATSAALATAPVLVLLAGEQGLLQGQGRFVALSAVLASAGLGKVVPAVVVLGFGGGPGAALAASAVGTLTVAVGARIFSGDTAAGTRMHFGVRDVLAASQVQLALIALSSIDLVLARMALSEHDAGLYALGAVATKAAFWLPQAVGVVLYPRMANPAQSAAAIRSALGVLVGLGSLLVVGAALAAPLAPLVVGDEYRPVQSLLWVFALQGASLAVLQGALLSAIAGERTHLAVVAWIGLAVEIALLLTVGTTIGRFVTVAASVAVLCAVVMGVLAVRAARYDAVRPVE